MEETAMKRIVLRSGLVSGVILIALSAVMLPLCMNGTIDFDHSELLGYSAMVLAFLMVFFGIRSYRDNVAGGTIGFGKAFQVGMLITLVTCAMYVIAWEITYFNFYPDFLDQYSAHVLDKMRAAGESEAAIQETTAQMATMAKYYDNILFNSAITFMEVFPVGLIVTLVSAGILRRKPRQDAPEAAVAA
jgi:predicted ABC-type exoprotein transport system permease subunit